MSTRKPIKIDPGLATIIAAVIAAIVALIGFVINNAGESDSTPSSDSDGFISTTLSESSEASSSSSITTSSTSSSSSDGDPSNSSISNDITNISEPIISSSVFEPIESSEPQTTTKTYYFFDDDGEIELFNDHGGEAYIYKKYLDENPIGGSNIVGETITGWAIMLCCNEKDLTFHIVETDELDCTAQYDLNQKYQNTYLYHINVKREENGDLKIEFDIDEITFDLRDSTKIEVMNIVNPS